MHRLLNVVCVLSVMWLAGQAASQPPAPAPDSPQQTAPQNAEQDGANQVVVPLSEPARRWIEQALRRQANDPTAPIPSTGDALLDDVLDVIRRQGSVLDGSTLDEQLDEDTRELLERSTEPTGRGRSVGGLQGVSSLADRQEYLLPGDVLPTAPHPDARFHVAESLLRTARELAALPRRDEASDRLIAAMREQATVLLVDEYSQDPSRFE